MSIVLVDGTVFPMEGISNTGELWTAVKTHLFGLGRIVVKISVEDNPVQEEELLSLVNLPAKISFETTTLKELIENSLEDTCNYIPRLLEGLEKIADLLDEQRNHEALDMFQQATEGLGYVIQVLQNTKQLLGISDEELGGNFSECREKLVAALNSLIPYLEKERFFDLSFTLREEVLPTLKRFSINASKLLDHSRSSIQ